MRAASRFKMSMVVAVSSSSCRTLSNPAGSTAPKARYPLGNSPSHRGIGEGADAVHQGNPRSPTQFVGGALGGRRDVPDIAEPVAAGDHGGWSAHGRGEQSGQLTDGPDAATADVVGAKGRGRLSRGQRRDDGP